LSEVA